MSRGHHALTNAMRQQAQAAMGQIAQPELATISSYDAANYAVKVLIQPDEQESNWMTLGAIGIGNGWGVAVGPQIGDQVLVVYEQGDYSSGTIVARIFSTAQQAIPVPSGEIWAVHQSESALKLTNDGKVSVNSSSDTNITVGGNANITATGNATISAKICQVIASASAAITAPAITLGASGQTLTGFVTALFMSLFNAHTHPVTGIGAPTGTTNQPMTSAHITETVTGG